MFPRTEIGWLTLIVAMIFIPGVTLLYVTLGAAYLGLAALLFVYFICSGKPQLSELEIARKELRGAILARWLHALWPSPERIREADAQVRAARARLEESKARHKPLSWFTSLMISAALIIGLPIACVVWF